MRLGNWRTLWLDFEFDPLTGKYAHRWARRRSRIISGFGAIERTVEHGRLFFAHYRSNKRMVFQAGQRRWALDTPGLRLEYRLLDDSMSSEFRVVDKDEVAFLCTYRHRLRTAWARRDPTYDNIDFEEDHFLGHLGNLTLPEGDSRTWHDAGAVQPGVAADAVSRRR
jgi:asparagine synthetase B (glutamine-hydrolysing)